MRDAGEHDGVLCCFDSDDSFSESQVAYELGGAVNLFRCISDGMLRVLYTQCLPGSSGMTERYKLNNRGDRGDSACAEG